jgi:Bacterial protein of unknown function (DUF922)
MRMRSIRTYTGLLVLIIPFLAGAQGANEETIRWVADKKLNWEDYKARPDPSSDAAASTTTYLGIEYHMNNGRFDCKITCSFSKTKSWGRHKTDHVLSHEQGHFDIAEIFARKLNKEMLQYRFDKDTYTTDLKKIYQGIVAEKEAWQNLYDEETDHSIRKEKQSEWLKKIAATLDELKSFAKY